MSGDFATLLGEIGAAEIGSALRDPRDAVADLPPLNARMREELAALLGTMNGFYSYEDAVHVYPAGDIDAEISLGEWNSAALWRLEYGQLADNLVFVAEDLFGDQFAISGDDVVAFRAETGERERLAGSLREWLANVQRDADFLTGRPIANSWRQIHGRLPRGRRLMPVTPSVLGGSYDIQNLRAVEAVDGMRFRGQLASQIAGLPEGTDVRLRAYPAWRDPRVDGEAFIVIDEGGDDGSCVEG